MLDSNWYRPVSCCSTDRPTLTYTIKGMLQIATNLGGLPSLALVGACVSLSMAPPVMFSILEISPTEGWWPHPSLGHNENTY